MAYGLYNGSVERIVAKLDSTKCNKNSRVFIDNEEVSNYGFNNGVLIVITKESELLIYPSNKKLNLFIIN